VGLCFLQGEVLLAGLCFLLVAVILAGHCILPAGRCIPLDIKVRNKYL
jgi:hypothetical protein